MRSASEVLYEFGRLLQRLVDVDVASFTAGAKAHVSLARKFAGLKACATVLDPRSHRPALCFSCSRYNRALFPGDVYEHHAVRLSCAGGWIRRFIDRLVFLWRAV